MRVGSQITESIRTHLHFTRKQAFQRAVELLDLVRLPSPPARFFEYPHQLSGGMRQRVMIAIALACHPRLLIADEATTALDVTTQAQIMDLLQDLKDELDMALIMISHDLGLAASYTDTVVVMYAGRVVEQAPTPPSSSPPFECHTPRHFWTRYRGARRSPTRCFPWYPGGHPTCRRSRRVAGSSAVSRGSRRLSRSCTDARPARTQSLLRLLPPDERWSFRHLSTTVDPTVETSGAEPLLDVRDLVQEFQIRDRSGVKGGTVHAVSGVSFTLRQGETLGLVGETGSGKSTIARSVLVAPRPKSGEVRLRGTDPTKLRGRHLVQARREVQMIFQDPTSSLDPKWHISDIVREPLVAYKIGSANDRERRVREVLDFVGLDPTVFGHRRPVQLSGGQCQRVAIARALTISPSLIVCDEAVSSLDVLIQAQVLNLFESLRRELGLAYLFIAHDLTLVKQVSDRIAVMYLGRLAELGPAESIYLHPFHPYTQALLASIPEPDPEMPRTRQAKIAGEVPSPLDPPPGCRFHTRCPFAQERCRVETPQMRELEPGHSVACHFPLTSAGAIATDADGRSPLE